MSVLLYFIPAIVLLFVSVFILVFCRCMCKKQRAAGGGVREDPNHFVVPAGVPDWVTSPALLVHHYYMSSLHSLVWETACRYFPSWRQDGPTQEIELGVV